MTGVVDVLVGALRAADARAEHGLLGTERRKISEVDDAVIVQRPVVHDRTLQDVDAFDAVHRRRVMRARVEIGREIDRNAVLHDEDLARPAVRRPPQADAGVPPETVVRDGGDAGDVSQRVMGRERKLARQILRGDAIGRAREILQIGRQQLTRIDRADGPRRRCRSRDSRLPCSAADVDRLERSRAALLGAEPRRRKQSRCAGRCEQRHEFLLFDHWFPPAERETFPPGAGLAPPPSRNDLAPSLYCNNLKVILGYILLL